MTLPILGLVLLAAVAHAVWNLLAKGAQGGQGFVWLYTVAASVLYASAYWLHAPISTTHTITSAIMGVGATKLLSAVRWGVAKNIGTAWVLTIPMAALVAACVYWILNPILT